MSEFDWRTTLNKGRASATSAIDTASGAARGVAAETRQRITATYDDARDRAGTIADAGQALSSKGRELGTRAAKHGKRAVDTVLVESRGLIGERPLTAVVAGIAAGAIIGFLANRLGKPRPGHPTGDTDISHGEPQAEASYAEEGDEY